MSRDSRLFQALANPMVQKGCYAAAASERFDWSKNRTLPFSSFLQGIVPNMQESRSSWLRRLGLCGQLSLKSDHNFFVAARGSFGKL